MSEKRDANGRDYALDSALITRMQQAWPQNDETRVESDPLELAAYLDGRLDEAARADFEAKLAVDPDARALWLAADAALGASEPAPDSLLARARALASEDAPRRDAAVGSWWNRLSAAFTGQGRFGGLGWTAAGLLFLAVCLGGFELGHYGFGQGAVGSAQTAQLEALPFGPQSIF
ncbi:MAG: hypothetical protein Kilf2KO_07890 [Rhodospirillales bacterium]